MREILLRPANKKGIKEPKPVLIIDNKIESVTVRFARCCLPCYGDNVVAHSDTERGMVIHHKRCKQVTPFIKKDPRYMPAIWGENKKIIYIKLESTLTRKTKLVSCPTFHQFLQGQALILDTSILKL